MAGKSLSDRWQIINDQEVSLWLHWKFWGLFDSMGNGESCVGWPRFIIAFNRFIEWNHYTSISRSKFLLTLEKVCKEVNEVRCCPQLHHVFKTIQIIGRPPDVPTFIALTFSQAWIFVACKSLERLPMLCWHCRSCFFRSLYISLSILASI